MKSAFLKYPKKYDSEVPCACCGKMVLKVHLKYGREVGSECYNKIVIYEIAQSYKATEEQLLNKRNWGFTPKTLKRVRGFING